MSSLLKRVLASLFIVVLLGLYIVGLIAALLGKDYAPSLLIGTTFATTLGSVFIHFIRRFFNRSIDEEEAEAVTPPNHP